MLLQILGVDTFTTKKAEIFSVDIDLSKEELSIVPQDNCIKIYHNGDYYVSTKEGFELIKV